MPSTLEAGLAGGADDALDHLAPDGDDDDARARAGWRSDDAERDCMSSTASSIGIGMWSGASARAAASSAFSSSITGRSSERTTMRWLAMPRRTRLGRSCSSNSVRSASAERGRVGDVAVAQDARAQVRHGAALRASASR